MRPATSAWACLLLNAETPREGVQIRRLGLGRFLAPEAGSPGRSLRGFEHLAAGGLLGGLAAELGVTSTDVTAECARRGAPF
jgi:hypothetical protein